MKSHKERLVKLEKEHTFLKGFAAGVIATVGALYGAILLANCIAQLYQVIK